MSNHSFDIFRKLSLLISKGIHLSDVLNFMGIDRVYIYGIGEMGKIVLSDLSGRFSVPMIFDQNADEQKHITFQTKINEQNEAVEYSFEIFSPSNIPDNSVPILITPAACYYEILTELREKGIKKQRLLSLNLLPYYGIYFQKKLLSKISVQKFPLREYLIVGGQFSNKGSQFMIFTAVNEIKNRYQDALVWFCPNFWDDEYQQENKRGDSLNIAPTFIKLDVEGAEYDALMGFQHTIRRYRPKMAVSVYHSLEDHWRLIQTVKDICPDYCLYLKHHYGYEDLYGTILYAEVKESTGGKIRERKE